MAFLPIRPFIRWNLITFDWVRPMGIKRGRERERQGEEGREVREWICRFAPQRRFNVKRGIRRNKRVDKRIMVAMYGCKLCPNRGA